MEYLSIQEIAQDLRLSKRQALRLAKSKEFPTITKPAQGGFTYLVPLNSYLEWKGLRNTRAKENNHLSNLNQLRELIDEWVDWCRTGKLIGRPLSEHTIDTNRRYVQYYFDNLPRRFTKNPAVSLDNLRDVLGAIDHKSFAKKDNIYKALRSYIKFLIAKRLASEELLSEIQKAKPKRVYPAKKVYCTLDQFEDLLNEAGNKIHCQSDYDVILSKSTIATIGFTGLRASELCNLRLQDIDLANRKILVYLGKGKKNRFVGINDRLHQILLEYLKVRPKCKLENFFVTISSMDKKPTKIDRDVLLHKVKRLAKRLNFEINLHGLRRTFATVAANSGKPINIISLALGHADLKTTQGYLMTSQEEVVSEMQRW